MNSFPVAARILRQLKHEKRTLGLMLAAPLAMLTLIYYIFSDMNTPMFGFDAIGAAFLGIIVYFFVFLVAGVSLIDERTTGMLGRMLVTPIRRWEIVAGYFTGFGAVAVAQSALLSLFYIYVLDIAMKGSFLLALFIIVLTAFNALTLGMLLSSVAGNQFQMMQFIPLVIIPQIIFCGLFPLSGVWDTVSRFMPLYYVANSLRGVVLYGRGIADIWKDIALVAGMALLFAFLNVLVLKKHRHI